MADGPLGAADGPRLSAAQLSDTRTPFSAAAVGGSGNSWRVLVQPLSGGRHVVIAYSLDDLNSTVTRLEIADAVAGAVCVVLLAGIGLPLVRASLAPLARIEVTATAIASGDLSRRIDQPAGNTEVGRLAEALDVMLASIETAYLARVDGEARALGSEERMRRFVADAQPRTAHPADLRPWTGRARPAAGQRGHQGRTAAADGADRRRGRPDGPDGGRPPAAGQV